MKLDYGNIQYVLDYIHDNTTEVRNIKACGAGGAFFYLKNKKSQAESGWSERRR
jgi:hypothetical protein